MWPYANFVLFSGRTKQPLYHFENCVQTVHISSPEGRNSRGESHV
jgi:hypothetical protein